MSDKIGGIGNQPEQLIPDNKVENVPNNVPSGFADYDDFSDVLTDAVENEKLQHVTSRDVLSNGRVSGGNGITPAQREIISNLQMPKPQDSFLHKIGRWFMGVINCLANRAWEVYEWMNDKATQNLRAKYDAPLPKLAANKPVFRLSNELETLGKLAGLDGQIQLRYFSTNEDPSKNIYIRQNKGPQELAKLYHTARETTEGVQDEAMQAQIEQYGVLSSRTCSFLFPHGEPRLSDIMQRASLQDCWFLSSIAAVLSSQGPHALSRLFSESGSRGDVNVRLGNHIYCVPMGDIANDKGERFGSNSANWVKVLETAMLMHTMNTAPVAGQDHVHDLKFWQRNAMEGITALLGVDAASDKGAKMVGGTAEEKLQAIKEAAHNGLPVVLGHDGTAMNAIIDGIAPGHAVAVVETFDDGYISILDPYGEIKMIDTETLNRCTVMVGGRGPGTSDTSLDEVQ